MPIDEYGIVVMVEIGEFALNELSVKRASVQHVDDNMGYSDVSQLTDLIEMGN